MKRPIFNQIERQIMRKNNSLYAGSIELHIAKKRFEKEFMKTGLGKFIEKTVKWLNKILTWNKH